MAFVGAIVVCFFIIATLFSSSVSAEAQCIKGMYHKDKPSPADGPFKSCQEYAKSSVCCKAEFTVELAKTRTEKLYNHTWDLCKPLSKTCEKYWIYQECFYQCSPYLYKWAHPSAKDGIHGVPICSKFCDDWFDACKDDQTCVEDVLTGYTFLANGTNRCPANSTCVTYSKMFKNGTGLCNKMWSSSYIYTKENAASSNCLVMHFKGKNPNAKFFEVNAGMPYTSSVFTALFTLISLLHLNIQ